MLKWESSPHEYSNGELGKLGKWIVFEVFYDGGRSRNDPKAYGLTCRLPGIKSRLDNYLTQEEAKAKAESVLKYWIENAGLLPTSRQEE